MLKFNKLLALQALKQGRLDSFFEQHFETAIKNLEKDTTSSIFQLQALLALFEDEQLRGQLEHWQYQSKIAYHLGVIHTNLDDLVQANLYFGQSIDLDFEHEALPHPTTMFQYAKTLKADFETTEKAFLKYLAVMVKYAGETSEDIAFAMEDCGDFYTKAGAFEKAAEIYRSAYAIFAQHKNLKTESIMTKIQTVVNQS